jgi:NAD(P)H-hydrate epimerase
VQSFYGYADEPAALGLVGSGNNGGDTLIALAELAGWGWKVYAYLVRPRAENDPLVARLHDVGGQVKSVEEDGDFQYLDTWLRAGTVLLDGVLGTGFQLPLKAEVGRVLAYARGSNFCPPVVAVDCPSGVDCDSGASAEVCLPAEVTVCMAAVKIGLLKLPAFHLAGSVQVIEIGLPDGLQAWQDVRREWVDEERLHAVLPQRPLDGHKGTFGTVTVAGGCMNYCGAPLLAGKAAGRMGVGLVQLAVVEPLHAILAGQFAEAVWTLLPHQQGAMCAASAEVLREALGRSDTLLVGPGLGTKPGTAEFMRGLMDSADREPALPALVVDADGLKLLAEITGWEGLLPPESILTPHPGEMAVLTGLNTESIQSQRLDIAQAYARQWGHVVVLKGAFTIVAAPDGRVAVIPAATTALAHAGTGDVLAGMIAALRAQGVQAFEAALAGAWLHAQAGMAAEEHLGHPAAVLAGDVIAALPEVLARVWR